MARGVHRASLEPRRSGAACDAACSGFTVAELLVVIGLIAVLAGFLLPTLSRARESARRVACLSNVRVLTQAAVLYATENDGVLPDAGSGNMPVLSPLSPRTIGRPPWSQAVGAGPYQPYVLPSIGGLLAKYLDAEAKSWRCPDAPENAGAPDGFVLAGTRPFDGTLPPNVFWPNYHYTCDKEWIAVALGNVLNQFRLRDWAARNVSGLRIAQVAASGAAASEVVLFHDLRSNYHSEGRVDIYTHPRPARYYASYGFLDGHAEGRHYTDVDGYLAQIHRPIRQRWFGIDFPTALPEQYD